MNVTDAALSFVVAALPPGVDGWGLSLRGLMGMVVIGGFLVAGTYFFVNKVIIPSLPADKVCLAFFYRLREDQDHFRSGLAV